MITFITVEVVNSILGATWTDESKSQICADGQYLDEWT